MKLTIKVTQDDIDNGIPGDECNCPIARAIKRDHGDLVDPDSITVTETQIELCHLESSGVYEGELPTGARDFIRCFDSAEIEVSPFEFKLDLY